MISNLPDGESYRLSRLGDDSENHESLFEGSIGDFSSTSHSNSHAGSRASNRNDFHDKTFGNSPWSRRIVGLVLLASAFTIPFLIHHIVKQTERHEFEKNFAVLSSKAKESFGLNFARMLSACDSLSVETTSQALDAGQEWPFVSLRHFGSRAESFLALSEAGLLINVHPFVNEENRAEWEEFVLHNHEWMNETRDFMNNILVESGQPPVDPFFKGLGIFNDEGWTHEIYKFDFTSTNPLEQFTWDDTEGPYFPSWLAYPVHFHTVNYNYRSFPPTMVATDIMLETGKPVFESAAAFTREVDQSTADYFTGLMRIVTRNPNATYRGEALSNLHYPIFDTFDLKTRKLVGGITLSLFWPYYFRTLLPPETPPIYIHVSSSCGTGFSFLIEGDETIYVGLDDTHDVHYDNIVDTYGFDEIENHPKFSFSDTSVPMDLSACSYQLNIYATKELESFYSSNEPLLYALIAGGLLLLLSLATLTYGWIVRRRHRRIIREAIKTGSYVSSIFPESVRKRLMEIASENKKSKTKVSKKKEEFQPLAPASDSWRLSLSNNTSICDSYPNCTMFFAKVGGFAKWSPTREPEQIFQLLEAVFQTMDKLARRRRVFKVETIADSFLAITGLPDPQEDHAWRMAKFARACIETVDQVLLELSDTLGADTKELKLQIGINSGPVTGGVMGGQQKARFQLFGDTVNTASRMMSTGTPGRVHMSKETAAMISNDSNRSNRTEKRQDTVYAKGKGTIETYWLRMASLSTVRSNDTSIFSGDSQGTPDLEDES